MQINVLLVDDEPSIIQALRRMLRSQDWNLFEANDGEEALDVLRREHIHVMVTDFKMPRRDGISLCHEARKISPYTYRLLLSGQVDYSALREAWHAGDVHRFVAKPWDNTLLTIDIEEGVRQQSLLGYVHQFQQALTTDSAAFLTDSNWIIRLASPQLCKALAIREEDLQGLNLFSPACSAAGVTLEAEVTRQIESGATWLGHFTLLDNEHQQLPSSMAISPLGAQYRLCVCDLNSSVFNSPAAESTLADHSPESSQESLPAAALHIQFEAELVDDLSASARLFSDLKSICRQGQDLYHMPQPNEFLIAARDASSVSELQDFAAAMETDGRLPAASMTRHEAPSDSDYESWLREKLGLNTRQASSTAEEHTVLPVFGLHGEILGVESQQLGNYKEADWHAWLTTVVTTWQSHFSGPVRVILDSHNASAESVREFLPALEQARALHPIEVSMILSEEQLLSEQEEDILLHGELVHHDITRMIRHFGRSFLNARQILSLPIGGITLAPEFLTRMQEPRNAVQGGRLLQKLHDEGMIIYAGHIQHSELLATSHKARIDWLSGSVLSPEVSISELHWFSPDATLG